MHFCWFTSALKWTQLDEEDPLLYLLLLFPRVLLHFQVFILFLPAPPQVPPPHKRVLSLHLHHPLPLHSLSCLWVNSQLTLFVMATSRSWWLGLQLTLPVCGLIRACECARAHMRSKWAAIGWVSLSAWIKVKHTAVKPSCYSFFPGSSNVVSLEADNHQTIWNICFYGLLYASAPPQAWHLLIHCRKCGGTGFKSKLWSRITAGNSAFI